MSAATRRLFHSLMLLHLLGSTFATAANIEVDLVFPRADAVYKPVWPFPVVFAVRNASQLWQDDKKSLPFWLKWDLYGFTDAEESGTGQLFSSGVWQTDSEASRPPNGSFLVIDSSRKDLVNATQRHYRLRYTATLFGSCPVNTTDDSASAKDISNDNSTIFSIDPDAGQLPNFVDANACPTFISSLEITDTRTYRGTTCPVVASKSTAPDPCGLKMDESLSDKVKTAMLARAECPNGTWPDPNGKLSSLSCNAARSEANAKLLGGLVANVSALVFILASSWTLL
ncbi:hypothetical protein EsH8_I_000862 [Colletotrichum jinshuiense]